MGTGIFRGDQQDVRYLWLRASEIMRNSNFEKNFEKAKRILSILDYSCNAQFTFTKTTDCLKSMSFIPFYNAK